MRTHCHCLIAALTLAWVLSLVGGEHRVRGSEAPRFDYRAALEIARTHSVPMIVIVTARDVPASLRLWDEFHDGLWARAHRGLILIVQVCRESEPELVRSWNVTQFPTAIIVGSGAKGVNVLGRTSDCAGGDALAAWLEELDSGRRAPGEFDPSVRTTAIGADAYPSQQQPPAAPSPPAAGPPAYYPPAAPAYAAPLATTSAGVIQVPSQNYVIQQSPPQIFMAPPQAPIVYVPQTMAMAMPVAPPPPANVFLPAAPAPATPVAAAMPVAAFAAAPAVPAAPAVAMPAAVTNQTLALPASQTASRVRVRGPGLFAASLARFGERLVQLGRARIVTTQETVIEPPYPQTATGLTTISTTSAAPIAPPLAPAAPPQPPVYSPQAPPPQAQPSPQESAPRKHFLFPTH